MAYFHYCRNKIRIESSQYCFLQLLKRERIRRRIYATRDEARQDIFDYIEMFYNPKRRHSFSNAMPPAEYEKQYFQRSRVPRRVVAIRRKVLELVLPLFVPDWQPVELGSQVVPVW